MEHLRDISTYYFLDPNDQESAKPISEIDCKIIENLISIAEKIGNDRLTDMLSRWKLDSDIDILQELEEYREGNEIEEYLETKQTKSFLQSLFGSVGRKYVSFGDLDIIANKIFSIRRKDDHDGERGIYKIVLNEERVLPEKVESFYMNIERVFYSKDDRDIEYENLKKVLVKNTFCKFLN